jgi:hypothetical protein
VREHQRLVRDEIETFIETRVARRTKAANTATKHHQAHRITPAGHAWCEQQFADVTCLTRWRDGPKACLKQH